MATWDEVAAAIGTDTRQLLRWRKIPGSPTLPDVAAWLAWQELRRGAKLADKEARDNVPSDAALPGDCDYDDLVKTGKITYAIAKVREQVISEKIANETKRVELQKARGLLVTKEEAERAGALIRDSLTQRWERAVARAMTRLADQLTTDQRAAVSKAIDAELDAE
jgi:hypothetical protein